MVNLTRQLLKYKMPYTPLWVRGVMEHPDSIKPFKPNALTYAVILGFIGYFTYNVPRILWYTKAPKPVATDAKKYDRSTKKYVE